MGERFVIRKENEETWRQCVERYGLRHQIPEEVLAEYDENILKGLDEAQAAWDALYQWDILDKE